MSCRTVVSVRKKNTVLITTGANHPSLPSYIRTCAGVTNVVKAFKGKGSTGFSGLTDPQKSALKELLTESRRSQPVFRGWLRKLGQSGLKWQKRWVELRGQTLFYYKDKEKKRCKVRFCI